MARRCLDAAAPQPELPLARPAKDSHANRTINSNDNCVYCHLAKRLLAERGIPYREVNLAMDADGRRALTKRTGGLTFSQILVGDEPIGGYEELRRLVRLPHS